MRLRNSTLKSKSAPDFYERVGKYILVWLDQNRAARIKPGNQKELAHILRTKYDILVSASQMSRYISGVHHMPPQISTCLIEHLNFKSTYFSDYYVHQRDKIAVENLTKEDLLKLITEQNLIMQEWKQWAMHNSNRLNKTLDQNYDLIRAANNYLNTIEILRKEIKELKKAHSEKN